MDFLLTIAPILGGFALGWLYRDALDFKIRCDRFVRELQQRVIEEEKAREDV